jgi:hypothetical protein
MVINVTEDRLDRRQYLLSSSTATLSTLKRKGDAVVSHLVQIS